MTIDLSTDKIVIGGSYFDFSMKAEIQINKHN